MLKSLKPSIIFINILILGCSFGKQENVDKKTNEKVNSTTVSVLKSINYHESNKPLYLPDFMHDFKIIKNGNNITVHNYKERKRGRKTNWIEPSVFSINMKTGITSLKKYRDVAYGGKIIQLSNGNFCQLWGERHTPTDIDKNAWKILRFRLLNSDYSVISNPQNVTNTKLKVDTFLSYSIYEEKNNLYIFWNMELNNRGETLETVKYKIFNLKTGKPVTGVKLLASLIGNHPKSPPLFISNNKTGKKLMIWKDKTTLSGAVISTLKRVHPNKITNTNTMSYFPDDVRGILFNDGSYAVCWMTWGRRVEKLFKKNLWCKKIPKTGKTGKTIKINGVGSVPKNHRQVNPRFKELLINDFEITSFNRKEIVVAWSVKDLSERYFYPLGIFCRYIFGSNPILHPKKIISFPKTVNLDTQIENLSVQNGKLRILYTSATPLKSAVLTYK